MRSIRDGELHTLAPLGDILAQALAELGVPDSAAVSGCQAKLRRLLGGDVFDRLMDTPKTEKAIQTCACYSRSTRCPKPSKL